MRGSCLTYHRARDFLAQASLDKNQSYRRVNQPQQKGHNLYAPIMLAMQFYRYICILSLAVVPITPANARSMNADSETTNVSQSNRSGTLRQLRPASISRSKPSDYLECVPYARRTSGIEIYGDAHTWWGQARNRYATGKTPRVGAVMAVRPHNNSVLGHVATVSRLVDTRTILLSHANWSTPGKIERNVTALDVSPNNDWSQVRIWYAPSQGLGNTSWPVSGFIYNAKPGSIRETRVASQIASAERSPTRRSVRTATGRTRDPIGAIIAGAY